MHGVSISDQDATRGFKRHAITALLLSISGFAALETYATAEHTHPLGYHLRYFSIVLVINALPALLIVQGSVFAFARAITKTKRKRAMLIYTTTSGGLFALISLGLYGLLVGVISSMLFIRMYPASLVLFLVIFLRGVYVIHTRQTLPSID